MPDDVLTSDSQGALAQPLDVFGPQGPTPKQGQVVPPTNLPQQFARGREELIQQGAEVTGVADVRRVLSGETPWTEAIAGALPMLLGGPEARGALRGGELGMKELAERYPKVGAPILKDAATNKPIAGKTAAQANKLVEAGKAYWGKQLTAEAELVQKARNAAQRDIDAGNYAPYFKVSERSNVNPTRYQPYKSTTDILPAKPETIKKYMTHAANPQGVARLQAAYEKGLTIPNAPNWYFLGQLEREFIREFGDQGPAMFKARVADALAATTGGADPNANLMMAHYGNYLKARGLLPPEEANQFPFPVGGRYAAGNIAQYKKMLMQGGSGVTAANPKRYNFSAALSGEAQAGTIDEQMSKLYDPKMAMPATGTYGAYQQVLNDLAERNGVDPRYFQEVAWSGAKAMRDPSYIAAKPMIQEYNEAIERTSRITGMAPADVVRRAIVRAEMPLYGAAGVIGAGVAAQSGASEDDGVLSSGALGGGL
jgi:hypothetical protein